MIFGSFDILLHVEHLVLEVAQRSSSIVPAGLLRAEHSSSERAWRGQYQTHQIRDGSRRAWSGPRSRGAARNIPCRASSSAQRFAERTLDAPGPPRAAPGCFRSKMRGSARARERGQLEGQGRTLYVGRVVRHHEAERSTWNSRGTIVARSERWLSQGASPSGCRPGSSNLTREVRPAAEVAPLPRRVRTARANRSSAFLLLPRFVPRGTLPVEPPEEAGLHMPLAGNRCRKGSSRAAGGWRGAGDSRGPDTGGTRGSGATRSERGSIRVPAQHEAVCSTWNSRGTIVG